jgi:hypothetical protein
MRHTCRCLSRTSSRLSAARWRTFAWGTSGRLQNRVKERLHVSPYHRLPCPFISSRWLCWPSSLVTLWFTHNLPKHSKVKVLPLRLRKGLLWFRGRHPRPNRFPHRHISPNRTTLISTMSGPSAGSVRAPHLQLPNQRQGAEPG